MKTLLAALAGVSLMAICTTASAETSYSAGYTHFDAGDVTVGGITGRASYNKDSWFGVEAEGTVGVVGDTDAGPPVTDVDLKWQLGGYAVAQFPVTENFRLFARAGYQLVSVEVGGGSNGEGGAAYGVGAQFNSGVHGFRADYTRQDWGALDDSIDAFALSYVYTPGFAALERVQFGTDEAYFYGTVGYSTIEVDPVDFGLATVRLGWHSGNILGIEAEVSKGMSDDTLGGATVEIDYLAAAYLVARAPLAENFEVFARVGYGKIEASATAGGFGATASGDGSIYGAGAQYNFGDNGIRLDYTKYGQDEDGFSVSYVRNF